MKFLNNICRTLLLIVSCSHLMWAQSFDPPVVKWGMEFTAPRRSSLNDIVGSDNTGIYAIKERYGFASLKYTLEHYDKKFTPTRSFDLDIREDGRECNVELVLHLRNRLYLFSSLPNSRTKKNVLSVQEINKKHFNQPKRSTK